MNFGVVHAVCVFDAITRRLLPLMYQPSISAQDVLRHEDGYMLHFMSARLCSTGMFDRQHCDYVLKYCDSELETAKDPPKPACCHRLLQTVNLILDII